jgi:hypothetical protein
VDGEGKKKPPRGGWTVATGNLGTASRGRV